MGKYGQLLGISLQLVENDGLQCIGDSSYGRQGGCDLINGDRLWCAGGSYFFEWREMVRWL